MEGHKTDAACVLGVLNDNIGPYQELDDSWINRGAVGGGHVRIQGLIPGLIHQELPQNQIIMSKRGKNEQGAESMVDLHRGKYAFQSFWIL